MPAYRLPDAYAPRPADGFSVAEFIAIIAKRKVLILQVTAALLVAAVLFAYSLPTVWTSSATVMLEPRRAAAGEAPAPAQIDAATLQNQLQILQSRELAGRVIEALELQNDPEFNGTQAAPGLAGIFNFGDGRGAQSRDEIVANFLTHIWAEANGGSTTITVGARSRDPDKAARIANALVNAYITDQLTARQATASQTTQWLEERARAMQREVQLQNEEIQRYRGRNGLTDAGAGTSLGDQQMLAINTQLMQARADLDQKLALQRSLTSGDPANSAQALASPLVQQLRSQQAQTTREEADLNTRYGPLHPRLVQLQAQRRDIDQKIAQEIARIAASVNGDVEAARSHLASLQAGLSQTQGRVVNQNMARGELASLEANAASTRTAYEALITRLRNAQDQDTAQAAEARLLSPATVPQAPASPKRKLIVGAALPLGLMLGTLLALLLEKFGYMLRPQAKRRHGVTQGRLARQMPISVEWNGPPILGEISNAGSLKAADYVVDWPASRFSHATVALLRQLESRGGEGAVVALTAPEPGDAKSVVAVALARAAARMGKKTVIIDCDPAHRTATAMGTDSTAGLYEVLTGAVTLNDALVKDPRGQAFLLPLNQRPSNASTMFASPQMARLIDILRDACDFVILDCGPALSGPDAALIAHQADATLLVSRREKLQARSLLHATQALQNGRAAPVGLVLAS